MTTITTEASDTKLFGLCITVYKDKSKQACLIFTFNGDVSVHNVYITMKEANELIKLRKDDIGKTLKPILHYDRTEEDNDGAMYDYYK